MKTITGLYSEAIIYTDVIEESALAQIKELCDQSFTSDCRIRIMPDAHTGAGCVIGFTADLKERVIPNIVGVDIGCGMLCVELGAIEIDFANLDRIIRQYIPSGKHVHQGRLMPYAKLMNLHCYRSLKDTKRIERSIGTLGGGNHFIEIDQDSDGNRYLVIHTGSRNLGKQIAEYYQNLAFDIMIGKDQLIEMEQKLIQDYKAAGRRKEIQGAIHALRNSFVGKQASIPKQLCYLEKEYRQQYLDDMSIAQEYATCNRAMIAELILNHLIQKSLADMPYFETVHNYIDLKENIVRKGAVSAQRGERLLIPINMRDGSLLCIGKGNEEWNYSAPHGAGRLYSRSVAKQTFPLEAYRDSMKGIYTTSVNMETLDECPMAYKTMEDIVKYIGPSADIEKIITPLYNFKASE